MKTHMKIHQFIVQASSFIFIFKYIYETSYYSYIGMEHMKAGATNDSGSVEGFQ